MEDRTHTWSYITQCFHEFIHNYNSCGRKSRFCGLSGINIGIKGIELKVTSFLRIELLNLVKLQNTLLNLSTFIPFRELSIWSSL